jgi:hypothetical protein
MDQIYQYTPLSKDICKLVFNYINYTSETLDKLSHKNKLLAVNHYKNIVKSLLNPIILFNLLLKSLSLGYSGIRVDFNNLETVNKIYDYVKNNKINEVMVVVLVENRLTITYNSIIFRNDLIHLSELLRIN